MIFSLYIISLTILSSKQQDRIHTAILHGNANIGYYYVNIYYGSPPKKQSLITDTGSAITAFPCHDCGGNCGKHNDQPFNISYSNSSTIIPCYQYMGNKYCSDCENNKCAFQIKYAEQSTLKGYYVKDYVIFGDGLYQLYLKKQQDYSSLIDSKRFKSVFGCTTQETNQFYFQKADGILGLSPKSNTDKAPPNIVDDLFSSEGEIGEKLAFSLCYAKNGGYMAIGGYDKARHELGAQTYTIPYDSDGQQYNINIHKAYVKIGDYELPIQQYEFDKGFGSFIDSGTTLVYADEIIYNEFMKGFSWYCQNHKDQCEEQIMIDDQKCFQYQKEKHKNLKQFFGLFPTIYFQLDNAFKFDWKPNDYLFREKFLTKKKNIFCMPFNVYPSIQYKYHQLIDRFILGTVWMRHWDILFDRQKHKISFTRSNCSNSQIEYDINNVNKTYFQYKNSDSKYFSQSQFSVGDEFQQDEISIDQNSLKNSGILEEKQQSENMEKPYNQFEEQKKQQEYEDYEEYEEYEEQEELEEEEQEEQEEQEEKEEKEEQEEKEENEEQEQQQDYEEEYEQQEQVIKKKQEQNQQIDKHKNEVTPIKVIKSQNSQNQSSEQNEIQEIQQYEKFEDEFDFENIDFDDDDMNLALAKNNQNFSELLNTAQILLLKLIIFISAIILIIYFAVKQCQKYRKIQFQELNEVERVEYQEVESQKNDE